jgi:hypothetical protein
MAKDFTGKIELDIRDSTPDWSPYLSDKAREGSPNVLMGDDAYVDLEQLLAAALARD